MSEEIIKLELLLHCTMLMIIREKKIILMTLKILILIIKKKKFNKHGIDINGLDKDGYNINGVNKYGVNKDGLNINNIEGTRKKYSNRKTNWITDDNGILYDQYGFDGDGFNKDGYNIYGFDKNGLNKDGLNKYGYKKSSGKGLNISCLPVLLSKIYTKNNNFRQ